MIEITEMTTTYGSGDPFYIPKLRFREGEITTVIGRNGSGKSTLLKAICGMLRYKGSIEINGHESRTCSSRERACITAYLPQQPKTVNIEVETLVEHGRYPYHGSFRRMEMHDRECIKRALEMTDMKHLSTRKLTELSGGEVQRAYLAMIIAQDTPMILLDEPTAHMDVVNRKLFCEILQNLKKSGKGVVMTCHDIEQSFGLSDAIAVMEERRAVASGTPEQLLTDEDLLRRLFGVSLKKMEDPELVNTYIMKR